MRARCMGHTQGGERGGGGGAVRQWSSDGRAARPTGEHRVYFMNISAAGVGNK